MKIICVVLLLISMGLFVGCKKKEEVTIKGCTDTSAINYNESANHEDGSCFYSYKSTISFWQNFTSYQNIVAYSNANFVQIYVNGNLFGYIEDYNYASVEPPCGNGGYIREIDLGKMQSTTVHYDVRELNESNLWEVFQSGTIDLTANECSSVQVFYE